MKRVLLFLLTVALLGCSSSKRPPDADHGQHDAIPHVGHDAHDESAMLIVQTEPAAPVAGKPVRLKLMIHEADGSMAREFEIVHEKLVHLIIVRDGLDEFAHVHPDVDDHGNLTITHTFLKPGKYRLFADHKPKDKGAAVATAQIEVSGDPSPSTALTVNAPGKVTADGLVAQVDLKNAKASESSEIRFRLTNDSGQPIDDLQPYLGARGHLVVIQRRRETVCARPSHGRAYGCKRGCLYVPFSRGWHLQGLGSVPGIRTDSYSTFRRADSLMGVMAWPILREGVQKGVVRPWVLLCTKSFVCRHFSRQFKLPPAFRATTFLYSCR